MSSLEEATTRDWLCRFATRETPCRLRKEWIETQGRDYAEVLAELESMQKEGWLSYKEDPEIQEITIRITEQGRQGCDKIWNPDPQVEPYWV